MTEPAWTTAAREHPAADRAHGSDINLRSAPQLAEYAAAARRIAGRGHRRVLDWGCGYGHMTTLLRELGVDVTPIDYDPTADGVRSRELPAGGGTALVTSEPVRLPFEDGTFDAVLSMGVLEHVQDPDASLDELRRILVPAGAVYCYKLANERSYLEWIARRRPSLYHHGQLEHDTLWTVPRARSAFERHGFEVREARYANMLPLTLPGPVIRLLSPAIWGLSRALARVPGLNRLATNVQVVAYRR